MFRKTALKIARNDMYVLEINRNLFANVVLQI